MSTSPIVESTTPQPRLSEPQRLIDAIIAPTKTFQDIRGNKSWWFPWVISLVISLLFTFAVQSKVGWATVAQQQVTQSPKRQAQIEQLPKDQQDRQIALAAAITKYISYGYPLLALLVTAIIAGVLMLSVNFGLGARESYMAYWALWIYSSVPLMFKYAIAVVLLFLGVGTENFDLQNPVATNLGALAGPGTAAWLKPLLGAVDIFAIWASILLVIGISIVCKVSRGAAAAVVYGWWLIVILLGVAGAALSS